MFSGPNLNHKLTTALIFLRLESKLVCTDIRKAFCQIDLSTEDQNKLLFVWFRNVENEDYTIQVYRNKRLSFGLRCSPCILMVALYVILMEKVEGEPDTLSQLKRQIYSLSYMDNLAFAGQSSEYVCWA